MDTATTTTTTTTSEEKATEETESDTESPPVSYNSVQTLSIVDTIEC